MVGYLFTKAHLLQFNVEFRILQFLCYCHFEIPTVREPRLSEPRKIGGHFLRGCVSLHLCGKRDAAQNIIHEMGVYLALEITKFAIHCNKLLFVNVIDQMINGFCH